MIQPNTGLINKIRYWISGFAAGAISQPGHEDTGQGLLEALLLGQRSGIDSKTRRAFEATGLLHFISLSGLHLGIVITAVWLTAGTFGLLKRARAVVCIAAIILFLLVVPSRAATIRAAIIGFIFCASVLFARRPNPLNSLSIAALILLLIRPTMLFEAGWQLSFACVTGIILLKTPIEDELTRLAEKFDFSTNLSQIISPADSALAKIFDWAKQLLVVGLAAWLGGAGILLYHFHAIHPFSSLWTVLVFPFVATTLILGYIGIVASALLPTAGLLLNPIVSAAAGLLITLVKFLSNVPFSEVLIGTVSLSAVLAYYTVLFFSRFVRLKKPRFKRAAVALSLSAVLVFTAGSNPSRKEFTFTALDVGHGQSLLIECDGKNYIFDAGSLHRRNIGSRIVRPLLRSKGINNIEAIIISHDDADHINGIPEIVQNFNVAAVYANKAFLKKTRSSSTAALVADCLNQNNVPLQEISRKNNHELPFEILWPDKKTLKDPLLSDNDKSMVALFSHAGRKILICSDIGQTAQQAVLKLLKDKQPDVVIAPHHGSAGTTETQFLAKINPEILICSCSGRSYESGRLVRTPACNETFYTARDGAVTVRINKKGRLTASISKKTQ